MGKDSPPKSGSPNVLSPKGTPPKCNSPPKDVTSPPVSGFKIKRQDSKVDENSVVARASKIEAACAPQKEVTSPPISGTFKINRVDSKESSVISPPVSATFKINRTDSKENTVTSPPVSAKILTNRTESKDNSVTSPPPVSTAFKINRTDSRESSGPPKVPKRENSLKKDAPTPVKAENPIVENKEIKEESKETNSDAKTKPEDADKNAKTEESNGVGDKIKKFEKAAEESSVPPGRLSRPGSVRGRARAERLGSDSKDEFPPPATPFKDNVHFDLPSEPERQGIMKNPALKWQRSDEDKLVKPEPQKIIKPEFKPLPPPADVTIRSPSLGAKLPDQFPSHGTAFRNVAVASPSPDQARNAHKLNEDVNTQNNVKACKFKTKEKSYSVSKGSSYFTRGSEEIWLVKKKDIEEIEERVLDSFRRAGGNICMRSESMRPSSDSGQSVSFTHATMGRNKRQTYGRSESLDPQWAGARAQTLKRQTSVACTCGHDKKPHRAKSADTTPRPRSRSHGDDNQGHVLDKYETLV